MPEHPSEVPDVIGFGVLNLDYIAGASRQSARTMELVQESTARFEWGAEGAVDAATIYQAIDQLGSAALEASLGGSAWNTISTLANMRVDLRLGYVGFVGRVEHPGLSFLRRMDTLGIDHRFVGQDPVRPCGTCLSYIEDGERILLTYPGANVGLADYLAANSAEIARYMAGARIVHVTSFLDDRTPHYAFEVLRQVKQINPRVSITFDPGHAWARAPSAPIAGILQLADYVVVNYREFKALGRYAHGESDEAVAVKFLRRCSEHCQVVVPKRYDVVEVFSGPPSAVRSNRYAQRPLEDEGVRIEDATGAGDTFAAGLLAALASGRLHVELGAYLGMSLARHKIRHSSLHGHAALPDLTRGFLQSADVWDEPNVPGPGIFIAHGPDPQWLVVRQFLEQDCNLLVYSVESSPAAEDWVDAVTRCLRLCSFAVCVLTSDDLMLAGLARASQGVINLVGAFQGACGFRRVALLVEEHCEIFSNMHGVVELRFRSGHVESTLWQLDGCCGGKEFSSERSWLRCAEAGAGPSSKSSYPSRRPYRLDREHMPETPIDRAGDADRFAFDVIGVGALNLDFIAAVTAVPVGAEPTSLQLRLQTLIAGAGQPFEWGTETVVDELMIYAALEEVGTTSLDATLGGSAFNAIFALTQMQLGLRLGFVGVAGRVPIPGLSSLAQFDRLHVDHCYVRVADAQTCGICFSLTDRGDRTLFTFPGANAEMADLIEAEFDALAGYLASARVVHVTSLLDARSPDALLELIRAAKKISPNTLLSFDPGHGWSVGPGPAVTGLLQAADFLLLNHREFKALGDHQDGDSDAHVAGRLLGRLGDGDPVVIVKRSDGVLSCRRRASGVEVELFSQTPLPPGEVRDATGAGDIFAAGLLAVVAGDRLQVELGSFLGMQLARHKLQYVGSQGHAEVAEITKAFIRSRDAERRLVPLARGVFVAHGGGEQWHVLKEFIEQECGLPAYAFESGAWESRNVTEALAQYLDRCSFAVCVLTAEDATQDGRRLPRQNVIHEAGLFQGRYGFDRVLLLVEEGCDFVAGSAGLAVATFPRNAIETVFWRLHKMIRTEGFFRRQ